MRVVTLVWLIEFLLLSAAFAQASPEAATLATLNLVADVPSRDAQFVKETVQAQLCDRKAVQSCVERLVKRAFQRMGYLRASAKVQEITFQNPARPQDFTATVKVEAEKVYRLEKIEIMRNHVLSTAKLPVSLELPLGKPVDVEQWDDFLLALQNAYHKKGGPEPLLLPGMRVDESKGTVVLSVDVVDQKH